MGKKKFVVYEIWTRSRVIEAESFADAYDVAEPEPVDEGWSLSNWHVVAMDDAEKEQTTGGLNYRQIPDDEN